MVTEEDDNFRIRVLRQGEMLADVQKEGKTVKWGRYLCAPQVYFEIVEHMGMFAFSARSLCPSSAAKRGLTNFSMSLEMTEEFGIEGEYLWPLIKSPKETNTIKVDPNDLTS